MKAHLYEIKCLTNLHVGSGDENYDIVDAQVERDPVTGMPTIFSSGVKGALREYLEQLVNSETDASKKQSLQEIINMSLGYETEKIENNKKKKVTSPGIYKVLNANMIARPLRISKGEGAYVLAGAVDLLPEYFSMLKDLGIEIEGMSEALPKVGENEFVTNKANIAVEGYVTNKATCSIMDTLTHGTWALTNSACLNDLALPVQARNVLDENGKSENLWYEEVVPHKSIFHFIIVTPGEKNALDEYLDGKIVQFGGNASIGYGLCKITKLN